MKYNRIVFRLVGLISILCCTVNTNAQFSSASLPPILNLILEEQGFSCDFSIAPIAPEIGSTLLTGEIASAVASYDVKNIPQSYQLTLTPILFSSFSDFENNFPVIGQSFDNQGNTVLKEFGSDEQNLEGQLDLNVTNFRSSGAFFQDVVLFARFSRLATEEDIINFPNLIAGQSEVSIGSRNIPCETNIASVVNWAFLPPDQDEESE